MTPEIEMCTESLLQIPSGVSTEPCRTRTVKSTGYLLMLKNASDRSYANASPRESADNRDPSPLRRSVMRCELTHTSSATARRGEEKQPTERFSRLVLLTITAVCSPLSLFINLILNKGGLLPRDIHHYCRKSSA